METRTDLPSGTVTLMFTDVEGSTELLHQLGDQAYSRVIGAHHRILREVFAHHQGAVVDIEGDAFFVAFSRAWDAVGAAVAGQRQLAEHPWEHGSPLRIRMGIHTGEPLLTEHNYVGVDVHRAARIGASGHGGQVVLSERTYALAREALPEGVTVRDLGEHRFKGIPHPEHLFQLIIPGLTAEFPPLKSLDVVTNNLPQLLTTFVGREREVGEVRQQLISDRLVTLAGPGGTGKTRLSVQVAFELLADFPRGVWQVELAAVSDPGLVPQAVASTLGLRELPGRPLLDLLLDYLRPKKVLLLLDNCEHLVEAAAKLAHALLKACPNLRILATSREGLGIPGEVVYRVPPLRRPAPRARIRLEELQEFESIRLFIDRAAASSPSFALSEANAPAVRQIVDQLDGIPLAIELAAARVKSLPVEKIATRLEDRFRLLVGGARTGLTHHQTLRATMDWSFDLLSEEERILFRRLSVFAGSFSLEAVETICSGSGVELEDILDLLARLVDKSLVVTEGLNGDVRYRMLETVRQYSLEKLTESGEEQTIRERHLGWYMVVAESEERRLWGPDQVAALEVLERELGNLRSALEWTTEGRGDAEQGLQLAGTLGRFWLMHGYLSEGRRWLEGALTKCAATPTPPRAKALYACSVLVQEQGDLARAEELAQSALTMTRQQDNQLGVALILNVLGNLHRRRGDYGHAAAYLQESITLGQASNLRSAQAEALRIMGVMALYQGDFERAQTLCADSLALWRASGDKWGLTAALAALGSVAEHRGEYERARILLAEAQALAVELGNVLDRAGIGMEMAVLELDQGNYARAAELSEETLSLCSEMGHKICVLSSLINLGTATFRQEQYERAAELLQRATTMAVELGRRPSLAIALRIMAKVALARGDHDRAGELYRESLTVHLELQDRFGLAEVLYGCATVFFAHQDFGRAARLLGAADQLRKAMDFHMPAAERAEQEAMLAGLRSALDEGTFEAAWTEGKGMSIEDAVADALSSGQESTIH